MKWLPLILLVLAALLSLIIGLVVLARDNRKVENLAFFGISLGITGWAVGIAGFLQTRDTESALLWAKFYYFAPILIVFCSVIFAQRFLYNKTLGKYTIGILFVLASALSIVLLSDKHFITDHIVLKDYGKQVILNPRDYLLYSALLLSCFIATIVLTFLKANKSKYSLDRQQAKIFLIGYSASCLLGVYFNLLLPGFGNYGYIALGPVFTVIFVSAVAYAIARHKLFDVRLVVARTLGYASSILLLSVAYGVLVFGTANRIFDLHFTLSAQAFLSIATSFLALTFGQFRRQFDKLTNKVFYRDAYEPQELFDNLNKVLVSTVDLNHLLKQSSHVLAESLKSAFCMVGLRETETSSRRLVGTTQLKFSEADIAAVRKLTPHVHDTVIIADYLEPKYGSLKELMQRNGVAVIVRMAANVHRTDEGIGYILLGPKRSGNPYTNIDSNVLNTVSKELIIAIQNAVRFEEIQNFNITLQEKVNDATRKLRRSNEKLKQMDETKDDFISMASHQLRTPLTSVKGYISMVLEEDAGKITATQRDMLGQAFFSSQRMVYLIADLLNVSRLKTGKFIIERAPVQLDQIVQQELRQLQETAAARSLTLQYDQPDNFPSMMLDETKTRQIIMNFIDNAIYYTPAGGHIVVRLVDNPGSVELRVEDNGIGVPKAEQQHLFTKFYRAGNARQARPDGTGLGLYMAKKVIVAQGGSLLFESEEGKGSTFGFIFSKSWAADASAAPPVATVPVTAPAETPKVPASVK
ncbi:MAG: ATP-binding protein [Patescibacteria group bacterium]|nr:ATP-binding protein [Patescibacteria group bacterium]